MKGKKVLIFDDNPDLLELCTIILEDIGCKVITSSTSDDADLQVIEHAPDIILMDNWLPNLSGIEATKLIRSNNTIKHIPVIYFSANNNVEQLAEEAGADDYLAKPFNIADLEKIVRKYVELADDSADTN